VVGEWNIYGAMVTLTGGEPKSSCPVTLTVHSTCFGTNGQSNEPAHKRSPELYVSIYDLYDKSAV
jgi:hypothetical protein